MTTETAVRAAPPAIHPLVERLCTLLTAPVLDAVRQSLLAHCGIACRADTGGGTSDGRFIAALGAELVELGPVNASIHKVDEHVAVADLTRLRAIYQDVLERVLCVNG